MRQMLGLLLFLAIVGIVAFNFERILTFAQTQSTYNSAKADIDSRRWTSAIAKYEDALKRYEGNMSIVTRLGWLYQQAGQADKGEALYKAQLKKHPDDLELLAGLASLLQADADRRNEVVDLYRAALKKHPENPWLLNQIGAFYKHFAERPEETREETRKWLFDQARYYYQLSLTQDPKQFQTQFNLGVVYQALHNLQPSASAYCQAVLLRPDSFEARYNLGLVLSELNYLELAYRQLDRSVRILSDGGDVANAQIMARKVQTVKNSNYHDAGKQGGLSVRPAPEFLDVGCLSTD